MMTPILNESSASAIFRRLPRKHCQRRYNSLVYLTIKNHSGNSIGAYLASWHKQLMCTLYCDNRIYIYHLTDPQWRAGRRSCLGRNIPRGRGNQCFQGQFAVFVLSDNVHHRKVSDSLSYEVSLNSPGLSGWSSSTLSTPLWCYRFTPSAVRSFVWA